MKHKFFFILLMLLVFSTRAQSEENIYIHIQTEKNLSNALAAAKEFTTYLPDVNSFFMGNGQYAIALGPYDRAEAVIFLRGLQSSNAINGDSYIEKASRYGETLWKSGLPLVHKNISEARLTPPPAIDNRTTVKPITSVKNQPKASSTIHSLGPISKVKPLRESPRQIPRTEDEWREIQYALRWAGYYNASIDGAFGPNTLSAVRQWQGENGFFETGIITDVQRDALFRQHTSLLLPLGMRTITDAQTRISVRLPLGAVTFDSYQGPFALFTGTGYVEHARIILISQKGDITELNSLFDYMQSHYPNISNTSQVISENGFMLIGETTLTESFTQVRFSNDAIKGFTLIWPKEDKRRKSQVLANIMSSIQSFEGTLSRDSIALSQKSFIEENFFKEPKASFSGFFVDEQGHMLTTSQAVEGCSRITFNGKYEAEVVARDQDVGFAILASKTPLKPTNTPKFKRNLQQRTFDISTTSYSFEEIVPSISLSFGADNGLGGLRSESDFARVAMIANDKEIGAPILDEDGAILGILTAPHNEAERDLDKIGLIADLKMLDSIFSKAGIEPEISNDAELLTQEEILVKARELTIMINCWE